MLKPEVLRKKEDFNNLYRRERSVAGKFVVIFYRKNQLPYNRKAFLASKKVGKSVQRNRARRLMKESFRQLENQMLPGWDLIFIARHTILDSKCADVKKSMEAAMKKAGIMK
ncbi:MAG: ribonuclease P protein component [Bacillota bacterium]|jgi:ribonuclease P protein component|nr:ribonuclease P protein component [Eubacteriales bacterium]MDI9492791.1 ribonuclease P protein component [Bacillota bacterium]HRV33457.1 ribonuclease P protein component [Anaerovoracaceae bacterium]MDD3537021.1 ribonuclease P protein component [Eubacteriales bacterium]MDD4285548.1 ribonuclease P protein component [Eubacteriales bacterium]